jgi:histidinol phosphatase-like PHP family hydrolase
MERRTFIRNAGLAAGMIAATPLITECKTTTDELPYTVMDLHVHNTDQFTMKDVMRLAAERNVKFGIVDHPAVWAIKNDADMLAYIEKLRKFPVYAGLQPMISGWEKNFSPEVLAKLDYILMDPQTIPMGNGQYQRIWELETYVDNTEEFMKRYMEHCLNILNNEKINIFGWPLFLPVCIARDYYTLWTEERMQLIISAARAKNIAIEINDMAHTPHEKFILKAKQQGLKFTFGSDSRNNNAGRLVYCKEIAKTCNLTASDFYVPEMKNNV